MFHITFSSGNTFDGKTPMCLLKTFVDQIVMILILHYKLIQIKLKTSTLPITN